MVDSTLFSLLAVFVNFSTSLAFTANLEAILVAAPPITGTEEAKVATKAAVYILPVTTEDNTKFAAFIAKFAIEPIPGIKEATKATDDNTDDTAFKKAFFAFK
nr:MAG TPA: hypothetical protein [Crassvirales sp.]